MKRNAVAVNDENVMKPGTEKGTPRGMRSQGRKRVAREKRTALAEVGACAAAPTAARRTDCAAIDVLRKEGPEGIKMLAEYANEIFVTYREQEATFRPAPNYMSFQEDLRWGMRSVLVDWIIDVHFKLNLLQETLHLAVNLIDRFLSVRVVSIGKLQLVGVSGLLVASKFEEVVSPSIDTFVVLTDRSFTEAEILRAEKYMLHSLEYKINFPSPMSFLRRCSRADCYDPEIRHFGKILLDLSLLDERFLRYPPSMVACSCMLISRTVHGMDNASTFHRFSRYPAHELQDCVDAVLDFLAKPIVHESIFKKYGFEFTKKLGLLGAFFAPLCSPPH